MPTTSVAVAALAAIPCGMASMASSARAEPNRYAYVQPDLRAAATPAPAPLLMTLISINKQRLYVYDANGLVTTSRVSTGSTGYETPKGIYSVIHKKVDHESNLYEGAPMPHMQRLLWSGIALHGGEVPRYPASHGCVRLPYSFAEKFYSMTSLNHRIVITPEVQAPVKVEHPLLFSTLPDIDSRMAANVAALTSEASISDVGPSVSLAAYSPDAALDALMAERRTENDRRTADDVDARDRLAKAQEENTLAGTAVGDLNKIIKKARVDLLAATKAADKANARASGSRKEALRRARTLASMATRMRADKYRVMTDANASYLVTIMPILDKADTASREARSAKAALEGYLRLLAAAQARAKVAKEALVQAEAAQAAAAAALESFQSLERQRNKPISIFVSSRTGRIALRQGFEPVAEADVGIANIDRPLGTYIFTATGWRDDSKTTLDWVVAAVDEKGLWGSPRGHNSEASKLPRPTDVSKARSALDRIRIPQDMLVRIGDAVKPGSTLIISDYDMARSETGKGTDFIVQMPEVVAKYRSPQDIARAKQQRSRLRFAGLGASPWGLGATSFRPGLKPRYGRPGVVYYVEPRKLPPPPRYARRYRSSIPSFFGYYDD